jgi:hypothetical protein
MDNLQESLLLTRVLLALLFENLEDGELKDVSDFVNRLALDLLLEVLHRFVRVRFVEEKESVAFGRKVSFCLEKSLNFIVDLPDDVGSEVHMDVVEADNCIPADIGRRVGQVVGDSSSQGLDHAFMHDPRHQTKSPSPDVLVMPNEVVSEGVAG